MTIVADASVVVAALIDGGAEGVWARSMLSGEPLAVPHVMPIEVANVLRRARLKRLLSEPEVEMAHQDLMALGARLVPYGSLVPRAWELRGNLSLYDACYVALAESLGAPLATLDRKLARTPGTRCKFRTP